MLDETEKKECLKILELLSLDNLVSLTDTVTGRVVLVENKQDAQSAIIMYTRTGEELLRRRKIRREHLYQYLAQEGQVEHPAADKALLLRKVLELWQSKKSKGDINTGIRNNKSESESHEKSSKIATTSSSTQVENTQFSNQGTTCESPAQPVSKEQTISSQAVIGKQVPQAVVNKPAAQPVVSESNIQVVFSQPSVAENVKPQNDGDEAQLLALHFSVWFYHLLESLGKGLPDTEDSEWGPQHFWEDAKLTLQSSEPTGMHEITVSGAQQISQKFLTMVVVDQLCLNPNLSNDSVKGIQNPHGLTLVMVCGTVHKQKQCIGIFEQTFGLIRDPTEENNWKIKFSKLLLKASASNNELEGPA